MRNYFSLLIMVILSVSAEAQIDCGSIFNPAIVQNTDSSRYQRYLQLEQFTANYISSLQTNKGMLLTVNSKIIIPVVVHVLHNGEAVGTGNNQYLLNLVDSVKTTASRKTVK